MNKFIKLSSLLAMVGVVCLSSGCSCALKQEKIDKSTQSISETKLELEDNTPIDFTTTYKFTTTEGDRVETNTYVVKRDVTGKKIVFETKKTEKVGEGEETDLDFTKHEAYVSEGKVYVKEVDNNIDSPYQTSYTDPYYVYLNSAVFKENGQLPLDFYQYSGAIYETYKYVPLNACSSNGDTSKLPQIGAHFTDTNTCEASKEMFKKNSETTYVIHYQVIINATIDVTMVISKDNRISSIKYEKNTAISKGKIKKEIFEFNVSFANVD